MASREREGKLLNWFESYLPTIVRVCAYVTSLLIAAPFVYHLAHQSKAFLGLLEDDYYYYATVADHFVSSGKLTYDGTTVTNGFHPLWFTVLAALRMVCGRFGAGFYLGLTVIFVVSMFLTYELGRRFASAMGASPRGSAIAAALYSFAAARVLTNGMECAIAVPLFLWLLVEIATPGPVNAGRAAKIGLISSLAILARLDIAIAVLMLIVGYAVFVRPPIAKFLRALVAFCAAGFLLPVYLAANVLFFGSPLPVSALAKRLVIERGFSLPYAKGVALYTVYGPTVGLLLPLGLLAVVLLVRRMPTERPEGRFAGALALVYAFVFFGMNALSGWIYFGWYAFPFVPATIAALVFAYERWAPALSTRVQVAAVVLLAALPPAFALRYYVQHGPHGSVGDNTLLAMSFDLAEHVRERQGLFAMGAVAGMAAYVMDKPVLQIEGIVADRPMVEHVRQQHPLGDVLREYHADYLIVSLASVRAERRGGCYLVTQPNAEWAGTRTAKMSGEICAEPVEHFFTERGTSPWAVFPTIETLVWDLRQARWRSQEGEPGLPDSR